MSSYSSLAIIFLIFRLFLPLVYGCQPEIRVPKVIGEVDLAPFGPSLVAANAKTGNIYVLSGDSHLAVLQGAEQVTMLSLGGDFAVDLTVDEERDRLYVANQFSDDVTVIEGHEIIATLPITASEPQQLAISDDGLAYVVSSHEIDPETGKKVIGANVTVISDTQIVGSIPLGDQLVATQIVADPIGDYIYVGGAGFQFREKVIAIKDMQEVARFDIGSSVKAMDVNRQTGDVYVLNRASGRDLTQFRNGEVIAIAEVGAEGGSVDNMRVHPVTGDVYVIDILTDEAVVVRDMEVIGRVRVGLGGLKMAIDPVTSNVYVANFRDDTVTVINGTELVGTIDVGWYPYGIGVNPANGWVYVSNTNDGTVTVLGFADAFERRGSLMRQPVVFR